MPQNRFFIEAPLSVGDYLSLEGEELHHLLRVMRAKIGESIELVNGKNVLAHARVDELSKNSAKLKVFSKENGPKKTRVILAQALPRLSLLDWIIEKGTELDATEFWLFSAQLSEKKSLNPHQLARLKHLAISALKQCGRLDLPEILFFPALQEVSLAGTLLFGDLRPEAPTLLDLGLKKTHEPLVFFIGPEKGFSSDEILYLERSQARGVHLHSNTLRTETAALAALAQLAIVKRKLLLQDQRSV